MAKPEVYTVGNEVFTFKRGDALRLSIRDRQNEDEFLEPKSVSERLSFDHLNHGDVVQLISSDGSITTLRFEGPNQDNRHVFENMTDKKKYVFIGGTIRPDNSGSLAFGSFNLNRFQHFEDEDQQEVTINKVVEIRLFHESQDGGYESANVRERLEYTPKELSDVFERVINAIYEIKDQGLNEANLRTPKERLTYRNTQYSTTIVVQNKMENGPSAESEWKMSLSVENVGEVKPAISITAGLDLFPEHWVASFDGAEGNIDNFQTYIRQYRSTVPGMDKEETEKNCRVLLTHLHGIIPETDYKNLQKRVAEGKTVEEMKELYQILHEKSLPKIDFEDDHTVAIYDRNGKLEKKVTVKQVEKPVGHFFILCNYEVEPESPFSRLMPKKDELVAINKAAPLKIFEFEIGQVVRMRGLGRTWALFMIKDDFIDIFSQLIKTIPQKVQERKKRGNS